jgi:MYXO-CTERM domain-containing protein
MPPARFLLLLGLVIAAAALTIWIAMLMAPVAGASAGWMLLPLLVAGLALVLRRRS